MTPILHSLSISDVFYFLMIFIFLFWTHRVPTLQWLLPPSPSSPSSVTKGRHHLKKNVFLWALPESPNPPKCIFQSVEVLHFSKCTRLTHLLSFVNLFEGCCWSIAAKTTVVPFDSSQYSQSLSASNHLYAKVFSGDALVISFFLCSAFPWEHKSMYSFLPGSFGRFMYIILG